MTVAVLQDAGRIALAKSLAAMTAHFAWGRGDGAWPVPPAVPSNRTTLLAEVGRRLATIVRYVVPATEVDFDVEMDDKQFYKFSADPTPYLYLRAEFSTDDALNEEIRECGLFFGTVAKAGVPAGQRYLKPEQVQDAGFIYHLTYRSKATREGQKAYEEAVLPL
ncbi:hypothetical protein WH367_22965 [Comamonas sp. MYb21]|uniref:hypothetical protein n=1 Tax=Comamonas sp. MYb21 TaxID=1848648 RepID=UPI00309A1C57